jgi:hypothetical protein
LHGAGVIAVLALARGGLGLRGALLGGARADDATVLDREVRLGWVRLAADVVLVGDVRPDDLALTKADLVPRKECQPVVFVVSDAAGKVRPSSTVSCDRVIDAMRSFLNFTCDPAASVSPGIGVAAVVSSMRSRSSALKLVSGKSWRSPMQPGSSVSEPSRSRAARNVFVVCMAQPIASDVPLDSQRSSPARTRGRVLEDTARRATSCPRSPDEPARYSVG